MFFDAAKSYSTRITYQKGKRILDFVLPLFSLRYMWRSLPKQGIALPLLLALFCLPSADAQEPETYDFQTNGETRQTSRIRALLEVEGELKLNAEGTGITTLPLQATSDLLYDEQIEPTNAANALALRSLRYYHKGEAEIRVGNSTDTVLLDENRQQIAVDCDGTSPPVMYCPYAPLRRSDLDLINLPGSSLLLSSLLPNRPLSLGETWEHESHLLAWLLSIEDVAENGITSTLTEVTEGVAHIAITGHLDGAVGGVATSLELEGFYHFDLASQQIVWLSLSIDEDRSVGHASPGFDVRARLRMRTASLEESSYLEGREIAEVPATVDSPAADLLLESPAGGFALLHSRLWQVMVDRRDVTLMRLVDHGDMIAQANIAALPDLEVGEQLSPQVFHNQVEGALGDTASQIVATTEETTSNGIHVIRVVATGVVSEMPVQWIYYHVTEQSGRRLSCVFTLEASLAERLGAMDQAMVESLVFIEREEIATLPAGEGSISDRPDESNSAR